LRAEVEALAAKIAGKAAADLGECERRIAEAEVDLLRIRRLYDVRLGDTRRGHDWSGR
jgi:hypothetical protein